MRLPQKLHAAIFLAFLISWTIALLSPVPEESASKVLGDKESIFIFGKGLHLTAYAWLAFLGVSCVSPRWQGWMAAGLILHGITTEFFQDFVGRTGAVRDALLDSLGVVVGTSIILVWQKYRAGYAAKTSNQE
jgi:VanZ family protein